MDSLPPAVLADICSYLPWRDRLASRQLSSKFRSLPTLLIYVSMLTIQQNQNTISFNVKFERGAEERWTIEIAKSTQKIGRVFIRSVNRVNERIIHKIRIQCTRALYHKYVEIFMKFFFREFFLNALRPANLNDNFLAKLRKTIKKMLPNLDWEMEKCRLEIHTNNRDLTCEERKFLDHYPWLLRFSPPVDFRPPADFWNIGAISGAIQMVVDFGGEIGRIYSSKVGTIETDLCIDNNFITELINKKKRSFISNTMSKVTWDFLINYVENCFYGSFGLCCLVLPHNASLQEILQLRDILLGLGCVEYAPYKCRAQVGYGSRQPGQPDEIIVKMYATSIVIQNDLAPRK